MDVSVQVGAKDAFLPNGFECIELRLFFASDKINLPKCAFSDLLVELEGSQCDGFYLLILFDELVELKDVFLPPKLYISLLLLLLSLGHYFLDVLVLQHLLDHRSMVRSVPVHRILFFNLPFSLELLK